MLPYQAAVIDFKNQNDDRLSRLNEFIDNDPVFLELSADEQDLLQRQSKVMAELSGILGQRIAGFVG